MRYWHSVRRLLVSLVAASIIALGLPFQGFVPSAAAIGAGPLTRVSVSSSGQQADANSDRGSVSADGRYVAFASYADNLVPNDTNGEWDIFVRDTVAGTTELASITGPGASGHCLIGGSCATGNPSMSSDGRYVVFYSERELLPGVAGSAVYLYDRTAQSLTLIAVGGYDPSMSADANIIAFTTGAAILGGDTNQSTDIYVYNRSTGIFSRASVSSAGVQGNDHSKDPVVSANGQVVAFDSAATNLVSGDTNGIPDVFVRNLSTNTTTRASVTSAGAEGHSPDTRGSEDPSISGDGRYVSFLSFDTDLVANDSDGTNDAFLRDTTSGTTKALSTTPGGVPCGGGNVSSDGHELMAAPVASDGGSIAVAIPGGTPCGRSAGAYLYKTATGSMALAADAVVSVSSDGRFIAFASGADDLVDGDTNNAADVFLRDTTQPWVAPGQLLGNGADGSHALSPCYCWGDPVNTATGNFYTSVTDATLPGIGIPFQFTRSYNSLDTTQGPMGPGWTFSYNLFLSISGNDATLHTEDGQQVHFANQGGTYLPDRGVRDSLVANGDGTYTLTRLDQTKYQFNSSGKVTSTKNLNNQGPTFSYSGGNLTQITDSVGRVITLGYTSGLLTSLSLPDGRTVGYSYTSGRLTGVTDIRGNPITYAYDGSGRLNKITDQNGRAAEQVTYGSDGRVSQLTDGRSHAASFSWDPGAQIATVTDERSNQWTQQYTGGLLVSSNDPITGETKVMDYDHALNTTQVTDEGNDSGQGTVTYKYDSRGNLIEEDDPASFGYGPKIWTYNALNEPTSFTDGRSPARTTRYEYDVNGNLTCTLYANAPSGVTTCAAAPQSAKATFTYDPAGTGLLFGRTDQNGNAWSYGYDSKGNQTSVTGPPTPAASLGSQTTMTYDAGGRLSTRVDPRGNVSGGNPSLYTWTYGYNNANQPTSVTDPLNHVMSYAYDGVGNLTTVTDANQHITRYEYDGNDNVTCLIYPTSTATTCKRAAQADKATYTYDNNNNLTGRSDGNGHTWAYGYDAANRPQSMTSPLGKAWSYSYYPDGLLKKKTLPSGFITYSYDLLDRLKGLSYSNSNTPNVSFTYDANGNRVAMTDGSGTMSYSYDDLNRPSSVTRGSDGFTYTYQPGGQLQQVTYPDGTRASYGYFPDNTLCYAYVGTSTNACSSAPPGSTTYSYDAAGEALTKSLPNGYVATMTYDRAGRLTGVSNARNGNVLSSFSRILDGVGNPTQDATLAGTINYTYDALDRLTQACYPSCSGGTASGYKYTYDPVGNILTKVAYTPTATTTTYAYNNDDQLCWAYTGTTTKGCSLPPSGATQYTFDSNGNEASAGSRTFTSDLENRLISMTAGGTTHAYTYDGQGNRLQDSTGSGASSKTNYLWDVNAQLPQLALERDGNNAVLRRYMYGEGLLSMHSGSSDHYYLTDPLGSVANLTSSSGATEWSYTYDPFGGIRSTSQNDPNAPTNVMQFTAQLLDPSDGAYYLRARIYDPAIGRFLELDPLQQQSTDPTLGRYVYVADRPSVWVDPSGKCFNPVGPIQWAGGVIGDIAFWHWHCPSALSGLIQFEHDLANWINARVASGEMENGNPLMDPAWVFKNIVQPSGHWHDAISKCGPIVETILHLSHVPYQ
jgi:RHS repeat-associated protein